MDRFKALVVIAVSVALLGSVSHAQVIDQPPSQLPGPGWLEFHDLSARLEAVEAENRSLRNEVVQSNTSPLSAVQQTRQCEACGVSGCSCDGRDVCDDCGWLDQIPSACKEGLSWNKGQLRIVPFGYAAAEMIASQNSYAILGAPLFLLPAVPGGIPDSRFTVSGQ